MNQNDNVTYLVGDKIVVAHPFEPYDELLCKFLNDLSVELRSRDESSAYPDVIAFAFWCRKANIAKLKTGFNNKETRLGLGMIFHITPSNVPVNFITSFFPSETAPLVKVKALLASVTLNAP